MDTIHFSEKMYEAAFFPELWVPLLDELAAKTASTFGGIGIYWPHPRGITTSFGTSPGEEDWHQTPQHQERWANFVRAEGLTNRGFLQFNPLSGRCSSIADFREQIARHIARGYGVKVGTIVEQFNGEIITLEFTRGLDKPAYGAEVISALNALNQPFTQSILFASRQYFERIRGGIELLNNIGVAAAFISRSREIVVKNDLFQDTHEYFSTNSSGRIDLRGSDILRKAFSQALDISWTKAVSVPVPADENRDAAVIQMMPLYREARHLFSGQGAILILTPVATTRGLPSPDHVSGLFGLTPSESRLALALTSGLSLRDSAANQRITFGTARAYLNSIFSKTGTNQQSALVSMLKSIPADPVNVATP
ncbi:helix-turn-helix transcriptional regulator [Agrobacterium tumefaciens]|uniref:helix-turn-helix transcriptional regulator n=1 Tax=Agrobacterium tumefaciens TaxID=358 RepID=UPI0015726A91|nr:helix-turn-helix transcriptional regulator [Agrobacterium tumefaciens]NSZ72093.1 helix-turn-helix transcriptional regulator [Agrobacterium tumefaciens]